MNEISMIRREYHIASAIAQWVYLGQYDYIFGAQLTLVLVSIVLQGRVTFALIELVWAGQELSQAAGFFRAKNQEERELETHVIFWM